MKLTVTWESKSASVRSFMLDNGIQYGQVVNACQSALNSLEFHTKDNAKVGGLSRKKDGLTTVNAAQAYAASVETGNVVLLFIEQDKAMASIEKKFASNVILGVGGEVAAWLLKFKKVEPTTEPAKAKAKA